MCFMVPTTAILAQQTELLQTYLGHCAKVVSLCGSDQKPTREVIDSSDIVVIMPQILV